MLTIAKFAPSMLERAFFTFTIVIYEKVEKGRISGSHEGRSFFLVFLDVCIIHIQGVQEMLCGWQWLGGEKWHFARAILYFE